MRHTSKLILGASTFALCCVPVAAHAQEEDVARQQTVVVTGSFIQGTPEDAALPVDVVDRSELDKIGAPSMNEILRNLPATQGLIAETNQFDTRGGQGNEGATAINLRGLGSSRTLVLYNGHRQVAASTLGVDVNFLPTTAIGSIEVLKDGAAALYGSDAIGGVVNMRTRNTFEGFEIRADHQFIDGSDGDSNIGAIFGHAGDNWNFTIAGEYGTRGELQIKDKDWALRPESENPEGGWSNIGGPGRVLPAFNGTIVGGGGADPQCDLLGGTTVGLNCRFQYTYFDNLIEKTETIKLFSTFNAQLTPYAEFYAEAAYSDVDIPEWNTSPSYPPQSLFGRDRFISASHPGLQDFWAKYPSLAANAVGLPPSLLGAYTISRMTGLAGLPPDGSPETGSRNTKQTRFSAGLKGELFDDAVSYDITATYSKRERSSSTDDMSVERMAFALDGLGGLGCNPATGTPGVGSCEYYNPFSNAIAVSAVNGAANPDYNPAVANSPALLDWLVDTLSSTATDELLVVDAVFSGDTNFELGGGTVGWAVGAQSRNEKFAFDISDNADLSLVPCPFNNPASITLGNATAVGPTSCSSPTGQYAFLAGSYDTSLERTIYGVFGELALPFSDNFDVQLALRFEDYGGNVGSTIDPKIAAKWQINDNLALRGSASTTFRGPPQSFLQGRGTSLQFIAATNAFKAVDTVGNADLEPETALATNFGLLFDNGPFRGSLDYWRFDFSKPLQLESAGQIVAAYTAAGCANGGAGVGSADCDSLRAQIFPLGTAPSGIERIERGWINGSDIVTSGIDFFGSYEFDVAGGDLTVGLDGTYTLEYKSDDFLNGDGVFLAKGGDFVGYANEVTPFQSLVDLQANAFARFNMGPHSFSYTARYKSGYDDANAPIPSLAKIDSFLTHDITYSLSLQEGRTRLSASVYNLLDEDPPLAATDLNYDPYQHSPFGRMIKVGLVHKFGGN